MSDSRTIPGPDLSQPQRYPVEDLRFDPALSDPQSITILRPGAGEPSLGKRYTIEGGLATSVSPDGFPQMFRTEERVCRSLDAIYDLLSEIDGERDVALVSGAVIARPNADGELPRWKNSQGRRVLCTDGRYRRHAMAPTLADAPRSYLIVEADNVTVDHLCADPRNEPEKAAQHLRALLGLDDVQAIVRWSSSAGMEKADKPGSVSANAHVYVLLSEAIGCAARKSVYATMSRTVRAHLEIEDAGKAAPKADPSKADPIQLLYTSTPTIERGEDPIARRTIHFTDGMERLDPTPLIAAEAEAAAPSKAKGRISKADADAWETRARASVVELPLPEGAPILRGNADLYEPCERLDAVGDNHLTAWDLCLDVQRLALMSYPNGLTAASGARDWVMFWALVQACRVDPANARTHLDGLLAVLTPGQEEFHTEMRAYAASVISKADADAEALAAGEELRDGYDRDHDRWRRAVYTPTIETLLDRLRPHPYVQVLLAKLHNPYSSSIRKARERAIKAGKPISRYEHGRLVESSYDPARYAELPKPRTRDYKIDGGLTIARQRSDAKHAAGFVEPENAAGRVRKATSTRRTVAAPQPMTADDWDAYFAIVPQDGVVVPLNDEQRTPPPANDQAHNRAEKPAETTKPAKPTKTSRKRRAPLRERIAAGDAIIREIEEDDTVPDNTPSPEFILAEEHYEQEVADLTHVTRAELRVMKNRRYQSKAIDQKLRAAEAYVKSRKMGQVA